jgi:tRNA threonylcarbamoyladenosine biosynthesis protein TsaE
MTFYVPLKELKSFSKKFWDDAGGGRVWAFHGEMGAGKTTTIAALCKEKGVQSKVSSPTFSIINEYEYNQRNERGSIFHIDLYRLNSREEVFQAGVEDCILSNEFCFVEWPQKALYLFDEKVIHVFMRSIAFETSEIKIIPASQIDTSSFKEQS